MRCDARALGRRRAGGPRRRRHAGDLPRAGQRRRARPRSACRASTSSPAAAPGPVHQHASEEEIFFVLDGLGPRVDRRRGPRDRRPATRSSTLAGGPLHTVIAGDDGLSVLAYGENHAPAARAPAARGHGPPRRGLARGLPRRPARARGRRRPARAARAHAAPAVQRRAGGRRVRDRRDAASSTPAERDVARAAGSVRSGLRHVVVAARRAELPAALARGRARALRRPRRRRARSSSMTTRARSPRSTRCAPATGLAPGGHAPRARPARRRRGPDLPRLRHARPGEIVYYPRSKKAWLGRVLVRVELAEDYWEGEV